MVCRPKLIMKHSETYTNIEELGIVLSELVEKFDGKPKEAKTDASIKEKSFFLRRRK